MAGTEIIVLYVNSTFNFLRTSILFYMLTIPTYISYISSPISSLPFHFVDDILAMASLVAQMVKRLPAMHENQVQSLGWEDPSVDGNPLQYPCLEKSHGQRSQELDMTERLHSLSLLCKIFCFS